jgi:small subunit ribosomal protein S14
MAKESLKAKERKRERLVAKFAEKRKALKAAGDYIGLDKLPKDSSPVRLHNRCKLLEDRRVTLENLAYRG